MPFLQKSSLLRKNSNGQVKKSRSKHRKMSNSLEYPNKKCTFAYRVVRRSKPQNNSALALSLNRYHKSATPSFLSDTQSDISFLIIQDNEGQFQWECIGFEKCTEPIMSYEYDNEKACSPEDAAKTIMRYFKSPNAFLSSSMGGVRIMVKGSDGKFRKSSEIDEQSILYKPLEIK